jgi:CRISPR system Cascade subunit CasB
MIDEYNLDRFVRQLHRLREADDRAALAHLRRGLGKPLGASAQRDAILFRCLGPETTKVERAASLIASLFGSHSAGGGRGGMGTAFARLKFAGNSEGVGKRLMALLNADREDLDNHLRHAVSLLKSHDIPIDWRRLLNDILRWDKDERPVQREWSRQFWTAES